MAILVLLTVYFVNGSIFQAFLAPGNIGKGESWLSLGASLSFFITLATFTFVYLQFRKSGGDLKQVFPLLSQESGMKFLLSSVAIAGVLMSQPKLALAQDTRLTREFLSKIMNEARVRYKVPAIAITVMNSKTLLFQEVQGVRVIDKPAQATLDDYFHIGSCSKSVLAVMAAKTRQSRFRDAWRSVVFC